MFTLSFVPREGILSELRRAEERYGDGPKHLGGRMYLFLSPRLLFQTWTPLADAMLTLLRVGQAKEGPGQSSQDIVRVQHLERIF